MRMLPQKHKESRAEICIAFTRHTENTGEEFLKHILSCAGTRIHHCKLNSNEAVCLMESFEFASEEEV
jgi:hypothetical protein